MTFIEALALLWAAVAGALLVRGTVDEKLHYLAASVLYIIVAVGFMFH